MIVRLFWLNFMKFSERKTEAEYKLLFSEKGANFQDHDYLGALHFNTEFYKVHCPRVRYLELDREKSRPRGELGDFYNEQLGDLVFDRELNPPTFPEFANPRSPNHRRVGMEYDHDIRFAFAPLLLKELDFYPFEGDHVVYANFRYEIVRVEVRPEDYWQHTNLPLNISAYGTLYRPGTTRKYKVENPGKPKESGENKNHAIDEKYHHGFAD